MKNRIFFSALILALGVPLVSCQPELSSFETDREVVVQGLANGNQFRAVIDIEYEGQAPNQALADQWVDDRALQGPGDSGYPQMVRIINARLQNVQAAYGTPEFDAALKSDIEKGIEQFNRQTLSNQLNVTRLEASLPEEGIGTVTDYYTTALGNLQTHLKGQEEFYVMESISVSATDSDGDGNVSGTAIDRLATTRYGRTINTHFVCPALANGACKKNVPLSQAELPKEGFNNQNTNIEGLENGSTLNVAPIPTTAPTTPTTP